MPPNKLAIGVASAAAIFFLGISVWLLDKHGADWNHAVVIYNAICSIAFSAFGVLLGAKVQEVNVAKAVADKTKAEAQVQNKTDAIKNAIKKLDDEAGGGVDSRSASIKARNILVDALG